MVKHPQLGAMTGTELLSAIDAAKTLQGLAEYLGQSHATNLHLLAHDLELERVEREAIAKGTLT